jgi:hypothetical protein
MKFTSNDVVVSQPVGNIHNPGGPMGNNVYQYGNNHQVYVNEMSTPRTGNLHSNSNFVVHDNNVRNPNVRCYNNNNF